jgi:hypothetical protein
MLKIVKNSEETFRKYICGNLSREKENREVLRRIVVYLLLIRNGRRRKATRLTIQILMCLPVVAITFFLHSRCVLTIGRIHVQVLMGFFFVIPFYLQSVLVHSANCVKTCIQWHVEECSLALLCNEKVQSLLWLLGMKLAN